MKGENTVTVAEQIGIGSQDYNLINVDGDGDGAEAGVNDGNKNGNGNTNDDEDDDDIDYDLPLSGDNIKMLSYIFSALMILIL